MSMNWTVSFETLNKLINQHIAGGYIYIQMKAGTKQWLNKIGYTTPSIKKLLIRHSNYIPVFDNILNTSVEARLRLQWLYYVIWDTGCRLQYVTVYAYIEV